MSNIERTNAHIPVLAAVDLTGKEGYAINVDGTLNDGSVAPFGVITDGAAIGSSASVAVTAGGFAGTVLLKLSAPAVAGVKVGADATGAYAPSADIHTAQVLVAGVTGELVEGVIFHAA